MLHSKKFRGTFLGAVTIGFTLTAFIFSACTLANANPCDTVSDQEISMIIDGPFRKEPLEGLPAGTSGCKYVSNQTPAVPEASASEDGKPADEANINFILGITSSAEQSKSAYDKAVAVWQGEAMKNRHNETVTGLGAEGFWSYGEAVSQLIVYHNTRLMIITVAHFDTDNLTTLFKAKQMAKALLQE